MPSTNELLNDIETELFSETGSSEMETTHICSTCGNQPCTCNKSDKVCPTCGKTPCQCNKSKSNNSTQGNIMAQNLFDDPELNSIFAADAHAPGEGADSGKEAKDPNVTEGQMAGELAKRKKCKSIEEELFATGDESDGEKNANGTIDGEETDETKKKKHKSDVSDLFSDELFGKNTDPTGDDDDNPPPEKGGSTSGGDDDEVPGEEEGTEDSELDLELAAEAAAIELGLDL